MEELFIEPPTKEWAKDIAETISKFKANPTEAMRFALVMAYHHPHKARRRCNRCNREWKRKNIL